MASNQNNLVGLAQSQTSAADQQAIRSLSSTSLPSSDNSSLRSTSAASGPPHYVDLHVSAGECVSLQLLDGQEQVVAGPATITMISQQQAPPVPIPVQVPHGHMIHQIADENGTLTHIILSVMDSEKDGATAASDPNVIDFHHLQTVDGQMYGYPPACCCCCYCDPNEAAAVAAAAAAAASAVPAAGLAGQPDVIMMTAPMSQHDIGPTPAPTTGGRPSGRNSANNYNNTSHQQQPYNHHHHHHNNNNIGGTSANNKFAIKSHHGNKGGLGGGGGAGAQYNKQHGKMSHHQQQHNNYGNHHHYNQTTAAYSSVASGDFPTPFHQDSEAIPFKTHQAAATYQPNVFSSYTASSNQNNQLHSSNHLQSPPHNRRNRSSDNHSLSGASSKLDDVQHNGTKRHTLRVNQQTSNAQGLPAATQQQQQQQQVPAANGSGSVSPMRSTRKQQKHNNAYQQPHPPNGFRTHLQASHTTNQQHQVTTLGSSPSRDPYDKRASNVSSEAAAAASSPIPPPSQHKWNYKEISAKSVPAVVVEPSRPGGDDDHQQQKHQNSTSSSSKKQQQQTVSSNTNKDAQALKSTPQEIATSPKRHQSPPVSETSGSSKPEPVVSSAPPTAHQTTTLLKPATPPPAPTQSLNRNAIKSPSIPVISPKTASSGPPLPVKESDSSQVPVEETQAITTTTATTMKQQQKSRNDNSLDKRQHIKSSKRSPVVTDQGNKRDQEASGGNQDAPRSSRGKQKKGSTAKDEVKDKQVVQEAAKIEDKPELKTGKDTSRDELARASRVELTETNDKPKQAQQQQQQQQQPPPPSKRSNNKLESSERVGARPTNGSTSNKHHKSSTVNATNNDLGLGQQSSATNRTNNQSSSHKIGGGVNHSNNKHNHQHHNHHNHNHNSNQSLKVSNLLKQCRNKLVTNMGKLVQNSLSSYSDTKFAGLILIIFTIFAMLLAIFIHYYIIAPVNVGH